MSNREPWGKDRRLARNLGNNEHLLHNNRGLEILQASVESVRWHASQAIKLSS